MVRKFTFISPTIFFFLHWLHSGACLKSIAKHLNSELLWFIYSFCSYPKGLLGKKSWHVILVSHILLLSKCIFSVRTNFFRFLHKYLSFALAGGSGTSRWDLLIVPLHWVSSASGWVQVRSEIICRCDILGPTCRVSIWRRFGTTSNCQVSAREEFMEPLHSPNKLFC